MNTPDVDLLRGTILRSVSRSFYLSLRILPEPLRDPVSLAYLLARSTDTIADSSSLPFDRRMEAFRKLTNAIQATGSTDTLAGIKSEFLDRQQDEGERALIDALPAILQWIELLDERDRKEVRAVLEKINRGQLLDLERFESNDGVHALGSAAELDEYTYLVAGAVGEFWTRICFTHIDNLSERGQPEMEKLGVNYGKGLQLINIIRDAGSDLQQGRCYLPMEELQRCGVRPENILNDPGKIESILQKWIDTASSGLDSGLEYACSIKSSRVRCASVLPALIGARTLALLRAAGSNALKERVKVPRGEVQTLMIWAATPFATPGALRKRYNQLRSNS